tara:strand:+ start:782 stop:1393 length:612 start_codon:yes stop_codon:yes gene_type:complete
MESETFGNFNEDINKRIVCEIDRAIAKQFNFSVADTQKEEYTFSDQTSVSEVMRFGRIELGSYKSNAIVGLTSKFDTQNSLEKISLLLTLGFQDDFVTISLKLDIEEEPLKISAYTLVKRKKNKPILPIGLGMSAYQAILKVIDQLASGISVDITHTVARLDKMEKEKWEDKFLPILSAEGYERENGMVWKKTYRGTNTDDMD